MSYTLKQLLWAADQRRVVLTAETAGTLVLSAAEQLRSMPRRFSLGQIVLSDSGAVLLGTGVASTQQECDAYLRSLLARLLVGCGAEHPPLLAAASRAGTGPLALADELTAALTPFNRGAARRALKRLHRRLGAAGPPPDPPFERGGSISPLAPVPCQPSRRVGYAHAAADVGLDPSPAGPSPQPPTCDAGAQHRVAPAPATTPAFLELGREECTRPLGSIDVTGGREVVSTPVQSFVIQSAHPVAVAPESVPENPVVQRQERIPSAREPLAFGRFPSRRSDVDQLLEDFSMEIASGEHDMADQIWQCVAAGEEGGVCTPPPPGVVRLPTEVARPG